MVYYYLSFKRGKHRIEEVFSKLKLKNKKVLTKNFRYATINKSSRGGR